MIQVGVVSSRVVSVRIVVIALILAVIAIVLAVTRKDATTATRVTIAVVIDTIRICLF